MLINCRFKKCLQDSVASNLFATSRNWHHTRNLDLMQSRCKNAAQGKWPLGGSLHGVVSLHDLCSCLVWQLCPLSASKQIVTSSKYTTESTETRQSHGWATDWNSWHDWFNSGTSDAIVTDWLHYGNADVSNMCVYINSRQTCSPHEAYRLHVIEIKWGSSVLNCLFKIPVESMSQHVVHTFYVFCDMNCHHLHSIHCFLRIAEDLLTPGKTLFIDSQNTFSALEILLPNTC